MGVVGSIFKPMQKISRYLILTDSSPNDLAAKVQDAIEKGWTPFGELKMNSWPDGQEDYAEHHHYAQVVVAFAKEQAK